LPSRCCRLVSIWATVHFVPFLNGKRLLTTQAFHDLFRSEVIKAREGIGIKDITLLFTDLKRVDRTL
jgi:hypothetical protein